MIEKEKLAAIGAEHLADILISLYENNPNIQKQLDITFAGLESDPNKIILMIKKELSSLKKSTRFIDYYESSSFSDRLNQSRLSIANDLNTKSPNKAMEMMLNFLDLHKTTLNRVDDSNGNISGVFVQACSDLGRIAAELAAPTPEIVELVFDRFMNNEYAIYDNLIEDFKITLQKEEGIGFNLLQEKLEKAYNDKNAITIKVGLAEIADCKKDVDAYIRACSFTNKPSLYDHLEIAKRLIDHWRGEEALHWLNISDISSSNYFWRNDCRKLKIQAFELSGKYEQAQNERITWFEENLRSDIYGQILKYAKEEFKEPFKKEAISKAFNFKDPRLSLLFLMEIQEFEEGAKFVRNKIDHLSGGEYRILRPAAEILRNIDPFVATLLYRKMIKPILDETKSKYYNYAAKDLVICNILSDKITNWETLENHEAYFAALKENHKRKIRFWSEYNLALQKK